MSARVRMALVALCVAGCLPAGDPPRGTHLLDGRDDLSVQFQPTGAGKPNRLLVQALTVHPTGFVGAFGLSVYDIGALDPATGQATKTLLLDDVLYQGCDGCGYAFDARGRLFMGSQDLRTVDFVVRTWRVDPVTAARVDIGIVDGAALSADRTQLLFSRVFTTVGDPWRVRDLDDREATVPGAQRAELVGNDVYFITGDYKLARLHATALDAPREALGDNVADMQRIDTARGSLLLLFPPADDPYAPALHQLYDPSAGKAIPLPGETDPTLGVTISPSPSGRNLLISSSVPRSGLTLTMFDRDTGETRKATIDVAVFGTFWRPGHEELWLQTDSGVLRWRAGEVPTRLVSVEGVVSAGRPTGSIFTPDGAWWLAYGRVTSLRSVEDLAVPPLPLHQAGLALNGYWALPDGRGISEAYKTYQSHNEISIVDPVARTQRLLGSGGYVVAVGAHHILAYLAYVKSTLSGTLALIDVDTGARTVLGEDVHAVAVEPSTSAADPLAPGTRVAFLVRSRIAGPYDGLWLAELP